MSQFRNQVNRRPRRPAQQQMRTITTLEPDVEESLHAMQAVCLWSGPRNVSTALMYSFAERADTKVVDEPLYGHFLRVSGTIHPGRDEVMNSVNCDGNAVMRELLSEASCSDKILFMKQMAHHLVEIDRTFLQQMQNVFLIRDPKEMLPSLTIQLPQASLADTGLKMQWQLFESLAHFGQTPTVIDSKQLLLDPAGVLRTLCHRLKIDYADNMLTWPIGPRSEDGIWAKYWYHAVHKSAGFSPYVAKSEFPSRLNALLAECQPWYESLFEHAILATHTE